MHKCFCCLIVSIFAVALIRGQEIKNMHWMVNGADRQAIVVISPRANTDSTPVIFVFHGHGGTMENIFASTRFDRLWPEAIIVCPQGLPTAGQLTDREGLNNGWQRTPGDMNDRDIHFFDAILHSLFDNYLISRKRIYAMGHSNGGSFTYLLWALRGNVFAAIASSGAVAGKFSYLLKPKPAMHIMGETDPLVKPAWQHAMCNFLLQLNKCGSKGERYTAQATIYAFSTNNPVVLYIHPGGHVYSQEANTTVIKFFQSFTQ